MLRRIPSLLFLLVCALCSRAETPFFMAGGQSSICDSLHGEARIVFSIQSIHSTHDASRTISSTIIPVCTGLPVLLFGEGHRTKNKELATTGAVLLGAEAVTFGITYALKNIVKRERPYKAHPDCISAGSVDDEFSFPSGHSSSAATLATYLSLRSSNPYLISASWLYAACTWYARMNLGVHYPSDVIAGAVIGSAVGYAAFKVTPQVQPTLDPLLPLHNGRVSAIPLLDVRVPLHQLFPQ